MPYKHIVFDIDGTLIDTGQASLKAWQAVVYNMLGKKLALSDLHFTLGISNESALKRLNLHDTAKAEKLWDEFYPQLARDVKVYSGIKDILEWLKQNAYALGTVTSKNLKEYNEDFLRFGLDRYFTVNICSDHTKLHKPNPDPLLKYLELSNAAATETLYIGDTVYDMQCAKACGVKRALACWNNEVNKETEADYYFNAPADLKTILL